MTQEGAGREIELGGVPEGGGVRRVLGGRRVEEIVRLLKEGEAWRDRIPHWVEVPAREGHIVPFPEGLRPEIVRVLEERGFDGLYAHQAEAVRLALDGRDVCVATPTASGKTLCYTIPILQSLFESGGAAKALCLFPTKALSQDQTVGFTSMIEAMGESWNCCTYDGDTPPAVRRSLRARGHLILTNPWMLHQGILPNHAKWSDLFRDLRWIVVDELHTLSGVFGSSVANVLRRLLRVARHYGASPRFLASSATLREAGEHAARLFGREVAVVDRDGSPSGKRYFAVYDPPLVDPGRGLRANALEEARRLAAAVCGPGHQTIFFCRRRTAVEVLTRYLKESAARLGLRESEIRGYRGGYLPAMRREIERDLKEGRTKVVVATHALELGIDIGALDVAVLVGYPGSQASFRQRAGRVGRRGEPSLVVQIARSDPLDQYLVRHPELLFRSGGERLALDPDNLVILSEQLKCAAFELPFREVEGGLPDEPEFGAVEAVPGILEYFAEESGFLRRRGGRFFWMADAYPAQDVTLKGNEPDNVVILDRESGKAIGEIDREGSITTVHEGAIYQVEGETWKIERFDYENRRAYARRVDSDYFTDAHTETELRVLRLEEERRHPRSGEGLKWDVRVGEVHVTTLATLYKKIRFYTRENLGAGDIRLPPEEMDSECFLLGLSEETAAELGLRGGDRGAAWRAVGAILRRVAPLHLRCQPSDLGLSARIRDPHFERPMLYLWDRVMGGVGLARLLFEEHMVLLSAAREVVANCRCGSGCPACVGPSEEVGPEGKACALEVLSRLRA